ncbi:MAG: hypothetical protein A2W17_10560 [Planctomycetes bacterium RBG_16_41_13]|nr:MAG: hypothetical protein A2W17_10560 [Planctomycetes bacterium RBG_16_41_13]
MYPFMRDVLQINPTIEHNSQALEQLSLIRDSSPYSSRNSSKGSLVKETLAVLKAVKKGFPLNSLRQSVLHGRIFQKTSCETRKSIWRLIRYRYLSVCPEWISSSLVSAIENGIQSEDFLSRVYLYYALRDRLTYDFIAGTVWEKWQAGVTSIDRNDFLLFLNQISVEQPHIKEWRESTRKKLAGNTLSAMRDFGLLKGTRIKHIQRPAVSPETVYCLLCILFAEGKEGRTILESLDWRLFLWKESDISNALVHLAQKKWIRFEKGGHTVILQLIRPLETYHEQI